VPEERHNQVPVPVSYLDSITSDPTSLPESIRNALLAVPRHRFLNGWFRFEFDGLKLNYYFINSDRDIPTPETLSAIYSDQALVTAHDGTFPTSSTSQPSLVVQMLELLDITPGMRILEIGTGTGYNAALLATLGGEHSRVVTIEYQQAVAERASQFLQEDGYENVRVVHGDGFQPVTTEMPFDRIIATVGCSDISPHWLEQLAPDGMMLIPIQHGFSHPLVRLTRDPVDARCANGRIVGRSSFMKIQGSLDWDSPWHSGPISGFQEEPAWCRAFPEGMAVPETGEHPSSTENHHSFWLFLSLCTRKLWYDNEGYGLVDPASESIVKFTKQGIEGRSAKQDTPALEQLYEQLLSLHQEWKVLGSPAPSDYTLTFSPNGRPLATSVDPTREWHIERIHYLETIRLT